MPAEDPLAEVIAEELLGTAAWVNTPRIAAAARAYTATRPEVVRLTDAVRAHIAASMEEMDKAVRCLSLELDAPVWDHVNGVYSNLRAVLLGTTEETTGG